MRLTRGKYRARVIGSHWGTSSKGNDQLELEFGIISPEEYSGETIRCWKYFTTPGCSEISFKDLETCGWDGLDVVQLSGLGSKEVDLVLDEDTYQGKTSLKVKYINNPNGRQQYDAPVEGLRSRLEAMRVRTGGTVPQHVPDPEPSSAGAGDDLPF